MKITDVRVRLVKNEDSKLKGVASVTFDECFVVHDIKIIDGPDGFFIAMPSRRRDIQRHRTPHQHGNERGFGSVGSECLFCRNRFGIKKKAGLRLFL